jgi:hypothetical protein
MIIYSVASVLTFNRSKGQKRAAIRNGAQPKNARANIKLFEAAVDGIDCAKKEKHYLAKRPFYYFNSCFHNPCQGWLASLLRVSYIRF